MDAKELSEFRFKMNQDVYSGKVPERIPVLLSGAFEAAVGLAKKDGVIPADLDGREIAWNPDYWFDILDHADEALVSDTGCAPSNRPAILYQILDAKCIRMNDSGVMQHPEVHCLEPEEYDEFIKDPMFYMMETLMPRLYPALDTTPGRRAMIIAEAVKANADLMAVQGGIMKRLSEKHGYAKGASGRSTAPFDYLADFLRSFSFINSDMRRYPEKVIAACDALVPLMVRESLGSHPEKLPPFFRSNIPLHMGSFISNQQFEKFWYPSMKKVMDALVEYGHGVDLFVEDNWMRHMPLLNEFTGSIRYQFEKGDPKYVKDLFDNETPKDSVHIIYGFYKSDTVRYGTKEQVIDEAKALIDTCASGGKFIFGMDKSLFSFAEPVLSNMQALGEFVMDYGKYNK